MTVVELPEHPVAAGLEPVHGRWGLTVQRDLPHRAEAVWAALTRAAVVAHWAPFAPARDLDAAGEVALPEIGDADSTTSGVVLEACPPTALAVCWDADELRFTVEPVGSNSSALRFTHTFADQIMAPSYAAGWHLCLAALAAVLDGVDNPPVAGEAAKHRGWERHRHAYGELLGIPLH